MQSLISLLTAAVFLLHASLGCRVHHAHATQASVSPSSTQSCGCSHSSPIDKSDKACLDNDVGESDNCSDEDACVFSAQVKASQLGDFTDWVIVEPRPVFVKQSPVTLCYSREQFASHQSNSLRLHVVYQLFLN